MNRVVNNGTFKNTFFVNKLIKAVCLELKSKKSSECLKKLIIFNLSTSIIVFFITNITNS